MMDLVDMEEILSVVLHQLLFVEDMKEKIVFIQTLIIKYF